MGRYWLAELWPTQGDAVPYVVARRNIIRAGRLAGAAGSTTRTLPVAYSGFTGRQAELAHPMRYCLALWSRKWR